MPFRVHPLTLVRVCCLLALPLSGCSCGDDDGPSPPSRSDGGGDGDGDGPAPPFDGNFPDPIDRRDAAMIPEGDPPEELEGETCAADTNKTYELAHTDLQAFSAELAVDLVEATFGMAFVTGEDAECGAAVRFATLEGPAGLNEPSAAEVYDDCTIIERTAMTRTDSDWLLAIVDNRAERELWVHRYDAEDERLSNGHRLTSNMSSESAMALVSLGDRALIVWTETIFGMPSHSLKVRFLAADGEPEGDEIMLEEERDTYFDGFSLAKLSDSYIALAYRRSTGPTTAELVLDVLDAETGERDRDPWVVTTEAGTTGTIDVAADSIGAGLVYSFAQGSGRQVWFQQMTTTGRPALVMTGGIAGGPTPPVVVVKNPNLGVDVSLAKLAAGYAVAYRALSGGNVREPQVRVAFLDRVGALQGDSAVALASETGGQTAIEAAYDGRVALTWTDVDEEGFTSVRALILPCIGGG
jgi:hypothetical protein